LIITVIQQAIFDFPASSSTIFVSDYNLNKITLFEA